MLLTCRQIESKLLKKSSHVCSQDLSENLAAPRELIGGGHNGAAAHRGKAGRGVFIQPKLKNQANEEQRSNFGPMKDSSECLFQKHPGAVRPYLDKCVHLIPPRWTLMMQDPLKSFTF